jgi:hypothetical protein
MGFLKMIEDAETEVDTERKKYIGLIKEALADGNDYAAMCWLAEYGPKPISKGVSTWLTASLSWPTSGSD